MGIHIRVLSNMSGYRLLTLAGKKGFLTQSHYPDGSANHQLLIHLVSKDLSLGTKQIE
jgi:hypothetical protein